jgi:bis(5'-nucleosyl)-tetraphosphatase (symmetrical)
MRGPTWDKGRTFWPGSRTSSIGYDARVARRVFVGDIQGCREELERLLEALGFEAGADRLEPVGDLVNRGPDSLGVLRLARSLGAGGVLGNHDLHLLRTAAGLRQPGPKDTFGEVLRSADRDELLAWLSARPFAKAWVDVLLVHAGLSPAWDDPIARLAGRDPLAPHPDTEFAVSARTCDARGARPEEDWPAPGPPYRPWFEHWKARGDPRTVVFGHWARLGLVREPGLVGLDTGCVWGGRLSAWIAEEDRIVSVPAARAWAAHG